MTVGRMQKDSNRRALLSIWYIILKYGMVCPEAMVFGTDIFALCDKLGLVVTCDDKSSVKELFEKQRVGVDALNTSHHAGRQGPLGASDATKKRLRKRVRDAAFPRRILDAPSAPKALEWASGLFGGNLLPKKGEPNYAKIVQKFRDVRKLYDDDSD